MFNLFCFDKTSTGKQVGTLVELRTFSTCKTSKGSQNSTKPPYGNKSNNDY